MCVSGGLGGCHVSRVSCQVSGVRCQVSGVTCHFFLFLYFFWQIGGASRWRVCYQRGLPRLVLIIVCECDAPECLRARLFDRAHCRVLEVFGVLDTQYQGCLVECCQMRDARPACLPINLQPSIWLEASYWGSPLTAHRSPLTAQVTIRLMAVCSSTGAWDISEIGQITV